MCADVTVLNALMMYLEHLFNSYLKDNCLYLKQFY